MCLTSTRTAIPEDSGPIPPTPKQEIVSSLQMGPLFSEFFFFFFKLTSQRASSQTGSAETPVYLKLWN